MRLLVPTRLSHRRDFAADSPLPPGDAEARIRAAISDGRSVESTQGARERRRLSGSVDGPAVRLTVRGDNVITRRKSWNIEFIGTIEGTSSGSRLTGSTDIPDRKALRAIVWMLGIACVMVVVVALGLAVRTAESAGSVSLGAPAFALVVAGVAVLGLTKMKFDGEAAAAVDAALLEDGLRSLLGSADPYTRSA